MKRARYIELVAAELRAAGLEPELAQAQASVSADRCGERWGKDKGAYEAARDLFRSWECLPPSESFFAPRLVIPLSHLLGPIRSSTEAREKLQLLKESLDEDPS